jgi:hypothetical protein
MTIFKVKVNIFGLIKLSSDDFMLKNKNISETIVRCLVIFSFTDLPNWIDYVGYY